VFLHIRKLGRRLSELWKAVISRVPVEPYPDVPPLEPLPFVRAIVGGALWPLMWSYCSAHTDKVLDDMADIVTSGQYVWVS
jgi:hypothetical protein